MIHWWLVAALAAPFGWRADGEARFDGDPPAAWSAETQVWRTPTRAWGNASVVPFGANVCVMEEPTTLACFDQQTGARTWSATNDWVDTLSGEANAAGAQKVAAAPGLAEKLLAAQREVSTLRRELRRSGGTGEVLTRLEAASRSLDTIKGELDALAVYLTPPDLDMIGYASATPVIDGRHLWVLSGQGVVSSFSPDGTRRWSRWVGPPPRPMIGYDFGSAASPLLAGGRLVVAHNHLQGLDPDTGAVVWTGPEWSHYGTPAVATVGGVDVLFTPDGAAYRASDGALLAEGLADIWYTGPVAVDDVVYWVGSYGNAGQPGNAHGTAVRVASDGKGGLKTTELWKASLPLSHRIYAAPLVDDGRIYVMTRRSTLMVLDATTGAERGRLDLEDVHLGDAYQSVVRVGPYVMVGTESGQYSLLTPGDTPERVRTYTVEGRSRSLPWVQGSKVWVRGLDHVALYAQ